MRKSQLLQATSALLLSAPLWAISPAIAHHGFTGEYDWRKPAYISGKILTVDYGYPHAQIRLELAPWEAPAAASLAQVHTAEGRNTSALLAAPRNAKPRDKITIVFDPITTRQLAEAGKNAPQAGQEVVAIAYERISKDKQTGELRALHVKMADGNFLSGQRRSFHVEK